MSKMTSDAVRQLNYEYEIEAGLSYIEENSWPELASRIDALRSEGMDDVADYLYVEGQKHENFRRFLIGKPALVEV